MTTYASANPYELWQTHTLLGIFRDQKPEDWYFGQFFTKQMNSTDEYIDFEKMPVRPRGLANFVKPMGRGKGSFTDKVTGYRFKPANIVEEDDIDPLQPLSFTPGIGESLLAQTRLTPTQRLALLKMEKMNFIIDRIQRRWEWMRARAIIDGKVTINYQDGDSYLVDFQRASGHTVTLTSGNRWGDSGISIVDSIQSIFDTMANAEFGGAPGRITMGGTVAGIVRKDTEFLSHMDKFVEGGSIRVDRGLVGGAGGNGKIYKFGEMQVGGASGQKIELWVNNETYIDPATGASTRYLAANQVLFTSSADAINGYSCFGRIVDRDADYQAIPIFPKNFTTGERVKVEHVSAESAPLFVPINSNATYLLTATA